MVEILSKIFGDPNKKILKNLSSIVSQINDLETIKYFYRSLGYYSPKVEARTQEAKVGKNSINLIFQ